MRVRLSHISIAVPDLESALKIMREVYGLTCSAIAENGAQGVRFAYVELGNARIELMQPMAADSPVGRFLTRNPGGGLHHLCLGVDAVLPVVEALSRKGIGVLGDRTPLMSAHRGKPVIAVAVR